MKEFLAELNKLYSQEATPSRLQIMTIHKSKGLEFDTVILPSLGSQPNRGDNPMLRWLKIPTQNHGDLLLVSPIQAAHHSSCALYNYLSKIDEEKSSYEAQRLLYVAVTRAKSRLYLMDSSSKTCANSFLSLLKHQEFIALDYLDDLEEHSFVRPVLTRLPLDFYASKPSNLCRGTNNITHVLATGIPRLIGIVAHQLLQWICDHHPQESTEIPWNMALYEFKKLGFDASMQQAALNILEHQITQMFHTETGMWIFSKHENERNEYELLVEYQNNLVTRILDRTFEENGKLWIIDFKTGKEDIKSQDEHQKQLNNYGYYLSSHSHLPIHCGIYYLSNGHWVNWQYGPGIQLAV
jgi:ATP-dependent exoDNAse (exonuclease V) beta subunit